MEDFAVVVDVDELGPFVRPAVTCPFNEATADRLDEGGGNVGMVGLVAVDHLRIGR